MWNIKLAQILLYRYTAIWQYVFMKTTIDIPLELIKKAKIEAVNHGVTLRDIVINGLKKELNSISPGSSSGAKPVSQKKEKKDRWMDESRILMQQIKEKNKNPQTLVEIARDGRR